MNIEDFYNSILNINDSDKSKIISKIVSEEKNNLSLLIDDFSGFCKYICNQIQFRLEDERIKNYLIDLNNLVNVDHVCLIAEYKYNGKLIRILIDPTYVQFVKTQSKTLISLDFWPSDKIDKKILNSLLQDGFLETDELMFNNYINSFSKEDININLESYLFNLKSEKIDKTY